MAHKLLMKKFVTWDELNELGVDYLKATEQKDEDAIWDMENVYEKVDTGKILILDRPKRDGGNYPPFFILRLYFFLYLISLGGLQVKGHDQTLHS